MGSGNPENLQAEIEALIATQIRPWLKIHGGEIRLIEVTDTGQARLAFEGACCGCMFKSVTYALGVRQKLLQHPAVKEVHMEGVRLSEAALRRIEKNYAGYSFWVGD